MFTKNVLIIWKLRQFVVLNGNLFYIWKERYSFRKIVNIYLFTHIQYFIRIIIKRKLWLHKVSRWILQNRWSLSQLNINKRNNTHEEKSPKLRLTCSITSFLFFLKSVSNEPISRLISSMLWPRPCLVDSSSNSLCRVSCRTRAGFCPQQTNRNISTCITAKD